MPYTTSHRATKMCGKKTREGYAKKCHAGRKIAISLFVRENRRNVQKSLIVQSCCLAYLTFSLPLPSSDLYKIPIINLEGGDMSKHWQQSSIYN